MKIPSKRQVASGADCRSLLNYLKASKTEETVH